MIKAGSVDGRGATVPAFSINLARSALRLRSGQAGAALREGSLGEFRRNSRKASVGHPAVELG